MNRTYKISLSPEFYSDTVHVSQYDSDYNIIFNVFDKYSAASSIDGMTAHFTGTRSDGLGFTFDATASGSSVSFEINTSMTAVSGTNTAEIVFYDANDMYFGSANVQVVVEPAARPNGTIDADTERAEEIAEQIQEIVDTAAATVEASLGTLSNLTTTDKSSVVAAINEVDADVSQLNTELTATSEGNGTGFLEDRNLLYTEKVTGKFLYYSNGTEASNTDWSYYTFIPVKASTTYYSNIKTMWLCYYDENKTYLSGEAQSSTYKFTTPASAKYVQLSYNTTETLRYSATIPMLFSYKNYVPMDVETTEKYLGTNVALNNDNVATYITHGKNLFNKYNVTEGYFISWNTGVTLGENSDYITCFDYISCKPSTTYVANDNQCIILEYDADKNFLAGHNLSGLTDTTVTTTSTTAYLRICADVDVLDTLQVEVGSTSTGYQAFRYQFTTDSTSGLDIIVVDADGQGDVTTITEAVSKASDGTIIYIKNGTYTEAVDCRNKFINFVGESKDRVIWQYQNGNYEYPPLEIAKGTVQNMTFYCIAQERQEGAIAKAYCVHIDFNQSAGEYLQFRNVKMINEDYQTIGIGLRANFTLEFDDCEFICGANNNAFYCHDATTVGANQKVICRNCTFRTAGIAYALHLQSQEVQNSTAYVTFQRCIVVNETASNIIKMTLFNSSIGGGGYLNSTDWHLTMDSLLNSGSAMNYSA